MTASEVSGRAYPAMPEWPSTGEIAVPVATLRKWHEALYRANWDSMFGERLPGVIFQHDIVPIERQLAELIEGAEGE